MKTKTVYFDSPYKKECLKAAEKLFSLGWEIYCSPYLYKTFSSGNFTFTRLSSSDYYEIRQALKKGVYKEGAFKLSAPDMLVLEAGENCQDAFALSQMAALVFGAASLDPLPAIICLPKDLDSVLEKIKILDELNRESLLFYASKALHRFSYYQAELAEKLWPFSLSLDTAALPLKKVRKLDYGENPHQKAFYYSLGGQNEEPVSYRYLNLNHEMDMEKASELVFRCEEPGISFFKHGNLAAFSLGEDALSAVKKIRLFSQGDVYKSVCCLNRRLESDSAYELVKLKPELVCAPDISKEAAAILKKSDDSIFIKIPYSFTTGPQLSFQSHKGGFLIEEKDETEIFKDIKVISKRPPSLEEIRNLRYAALLSSFERPYSCVLFAQNFLLASSGPHPCLASACDTVLFKLKNKMNLPRFSKPSAASCSPFGHQPLEKIISAGISSFVCPADGFDYDSVSQLIDKNNISAVLLPKRHFRH